MTITNHLLAGSLIGLSIKEPTLAIIISFASHFAMDAMPHFGYPGRRGYPEVLSHKLSYVVGFITFVSSALVVSFLIFNNLWFPLICGLIAASPDIIGVYNYLAYEKKGIYAGGLLRLFHVQFHRRIQKFERPWGIYIELILSVILLLILLNSF